MNRESDRAPLLIWVVFTVVAVAIIGLKLWEPWVSKDKSSPAEAPAVAQQRQQQWQLCWEKKPEYEGKTGTRYKCLPAKIESRNESHIIISYSYSGGRGIQEGTSTDGINYDGAWNDSTGRGNWHLRFTSSDTAFGWSDDEGKGEKQPNVLEKIKT